MTENVDTKQALKKKVKQTLDFHLALISDRGDQHHAYGLIDMAVALELLSDEEAREYRSAADSMRKEREKREDS